MSSLDLEEPWGLLVLVEGGEEVRVPMVGNRLTIGRGKGERLQSLGSSPDSRIYIPLYSQCNN